MACTNALRPRQLFNHRINCEENQICTLRKKSLRWSCNSVHATLRSQVDSSGTGSRKQAPEELETETLKAEVGKALHEKIVALEKKDIKDVDSLAKLKVSIEKTALADVTLTVEKSIKEATNIAVSSLSEDLKTITDEAKLAVDVAKERARVAEHALAQKLAALDSIFPTQEVSATLALEKTISVLKEELELSKQEVERLKEVIDRAQAHEIKKEQEKKLVELEGKFTTTIEGLKLAAAEREAAIKESYEAHTCALKAAVEAFHKVENLKEEANSRRLRALESSLAAAEASILSWKERALNTEALIQQADANSAAPSGRVARLLHTEPDISDLLKNGPRREIPEWMRRRIQVGLQGIPPRQYFTDPDDPMLPLPSLNEVWSVAKAKVKQDDLLAKEVVAKEALNKQRRDLEQALEETATKKKKKASEKQESGTGSGYEIVFQGFNWESCRKHWFPDLGSKASDLSQSGITTVWLPPPTQSVAPQGYMPTDLYNLNSAYGTMDELKHCIQEMHKNDILVLGDVVLNHRCAQKQSANGVWNVFSGKLAWGPEAIVGDDPNFQGQGRPSSGEIFHAAPNIDHSQDFVRKDIIEYLQWLKREIGFDGWRLDFVRGFWGGYVKEYIESTDPAFAIGEYWDSLQYEGGNLSYNQDAHRQRIINWINATGGTSSAFDVTTKGILHAALHNEYWRLIDPQQKPPGVMGWWPSRAVTFLENHDTGSTQGHWPFPRDKLMQGYAYILTHPGTPVIFYDHFYDFGLRDPIVDLISARKRAGIHCRSIVKILHAVREGYVAKVGDNLVVKLGFLDWNPSKQIDLVGNWEKIIDHATDYQVWITQ